MEKKISVTGIGTIILRKSLRAKRISIRISHKGKVSVVVPYHISYREGLLFLEKKKEWVNKSLRHIEKNEYTEKKYAPGENPFTRYHKLLLEPADVNVSQGLVKDHEVILRYPSSWPAYHPELLKFISFIYIETLRREAKQILPVRVRQLADIFGYSFNRIFIKNTKTRWGSCSAAQNINLNIHMMQLPDYLIDYIILHELAHTVYKDHGAGFWAELNRSTGRAKELDRELKKYHISSWIL